MRPREYTVDKEVVLKAMGLGVAGDARKRLERMALRGAAYTSEYGNRRFENFVLRVERDRITDVNIVTDE